MLIGSPLSSFATSQEHRWRALLRLHRTVLMVLYHILRLPEAAAVVTVAGGVVTPTTYAVI